MKDDKLENLKKKFDGVLELETYPDGGGPGMCKFLSSKLVCIKCGMEYGTSEEDLVEQIKSYWISKFQELIQKLENA